MAFAIHWYESAMNIHVYPIPIPPSSPSPFHPSGSSQCTSPEQLSHASNLGWWSVSPLIVYVFQCYFLRTSHPRLLPQSPKVCSVQRWQVLFESTLLRLPSAPWAHYPKWGLSFMHLPDLSHSGSWVLFKGTDNYWLCSLCPPQVKAIQMTWWWARYCPRCAMQLMHLMHLSSNSHSALLDAPEGNVFGVPMSPAGSWAQTVTFPAYVNTPWTLEVKVRKLSSLLGACWEISSLGPR